MEYRQRDRRRAEAERFSAFIFALLYGYRLMAQKVAVPDDEPAIHAEGG